MQNKRKRSKKRRLLLALLMLLLTGLMTVTSTYAWFTANKTVSVNSINVNVAASSGLQISVDGVEWKPVITNEDIINTINGTNENYPDNKNQFPQDDESLAPISTVGDVDAAGLMKMFLGSVSAGGDGSYALTASADVETKGQTGNFIAFDLFIKVQEETTVYLTEKSKVTAKAGGKETGIENAARVGFVVGGEDNTTTAGAGATTIQALHGNDAVIWEPNNDTHTPSGIANALSVYHKEDLTGTLDDPVEYYGVNQAIPVGVKLDSTETYFTKVTPDISTQKTAGISVDAYKQAFVLPAGVSKVRVYLWVEGQDVDCEDVVSGGDITFDLEFSSNASING